MTLDEPTPPSVRAVVALGSNLGDRRGHLHRALQRLGACEHTRVAKVSRWYTTAPVGGPPGQEPYLNGVCELETRLDARALLQHLRAIEDRAGRSRKVPNGPRTLDLDLCFYGEDCIETQDLIVPHPRLEFRTFVLEPLAELDPERVLAGCGLSVRARLDQLTRETSP